jgi:hypothetical protein
MIYFKVQSRHLPEEIKENYEHFHRQESSMTHRIPTGYLPNTSLGPFPLQPVQPCDGWLIMLLNDTVSVSNVIYSVELYNCAIYWMKWHRLLSGMNPALAWKDSGKPRKASPTVAETRSGIRKLRPTGDVCKICWDIRLFYILLFIYNQSYRCNRLWRPIRLPDVEAPIFSRQSTPRWRWGWRPYEPAAFYPLEDSWYSFLLEDD